MTATIVDQRCPACGHLVGQEEHVRVLANIDRLAEEKMNGELEEMERKHQEELEQTRVNKEEMNGELEELRYELDKKDRLIKDVQSNIEGLATQKATSKIEEMESKHQEELEQSRINKEEEIARAVREKEWKHQEERAAYRTQIDRLEKDNRDLTAKAEEQKKKIDNMSSEFGGSKGELHLLETLESAFPNDKLIPKKVAVDMADIIQTVVTENGIKRIEHEPPIVWDRKTSDKVTPSDICKAKNYKTKHNTDYSIIVTEKGITTKDSENRVFGMREGIYLVHPTAVVDIARIFRSFIIDKAKQTSSDIDRTSKQARLYEYLKSSEYGRTIETMREGKIKLDDLQRKEEKYHKDLWKDRTKIIEAWSRIVEQNQEKIDDVMRDQTSEDSKDDSN
jgi:hypothetical protein